MSRAHAPFQNAGLELGILEGLRGQGGQRQAAAIWEIDPEKYVKKTAPWPLNPDGELPLGLKIDDRHCVAIADVLAATPGISFAEWGLGDMAMSHGYSYPQQEPHLPDLVEARDKVKAACDKAGIAFATNGFHRSS